MLLFATLGLAAQPQGPTIEATKQDFTKAAPLRSTSLTTFGIRLGDPVQDAEAKAAAAGLKKHIDRVSGLVTWRDASGKEVIALRGEGHVTAVIWYGPMASRLAGRARELFHERLLDRDDAVRLELLGREDRRAEDPMPGGGPLVSVSYDKEGIRIFQSEIGGKWNLPIIHLVAPAKPR